MLRVTVDQHVKGLEDDGGKASGRWRSGRLPSFSFGSF